MLNYNKNYYESINWFLSIVLKTIKLYNQKIENTVSSYHKLNDETFKEYKKYKEVLSMLFSCNEIVTYNDIRNNLLHIKAKKTIDILVFDLIDDKILLEVKEKQYKLEIK